MEDIIQSRNRAMIAQKWIFGEKLHRIGNPYIWLDDEDNPMLTYNISPGTGFLQCLSMFYDYFPTPREITTDDHDQMKKHIEGVLQKAFEHFVPFIDPKEYDFEKHIVITALVRLQDYCFLKTFCKELYGSSINHIDIGPGLGASAIYSLKGFASCFYALEAVPSLYSVQRDFFRFLSKEEGMYIDLIECENLGIEVSSKVHENSKYNIKHVPSWLFDNVGDESIDLATGTWVLNELSVAGSLWIMSHLSRILREGGYLYIRDGERVRDNSINFDKLAIELGFTEVARLQVKSRVDFQGIPRVYQKRDKSKFSFDDLVKKCLGEFVSPVHNKYERKKAPERAT